MTQSSRIMRLGFTAFILAFASPVQAEGNRLLPFWAQPYPYGYAYADRDTLPPCRNLGPRDRIRGRSEDPRCEVVLHARD